MKNNKWFFRLATAAKQKAIHLPFTDTFTRANGAVGNDWVYDAGMWAISGNKLVGTPTQGAERLTNPGFEAPYAAVSGHTIPTVGWTLGAVHNGNYAQETTDVHGGASAMSIDPTAGKLRSQLNSNAAFLANRWGILSTYTKCTNFVSDGGLIYLNDISLSGVPTNFNPATVTDADYKQTRISWLNGPSTVTALIDTRTSGDSPVLHDDYSAKLFTTSNLFITRQFIPANFHIIATLKATDSHLCHGIVLCVDNPAAPQNYIVWNLKAGRPSTISKCVNGIVTHLITNILYAPLDKSYVVEVIRDGNTFEFRTQAGNLVTSQTITDASIIGNGNHGVFSTDPTESFSFFHIQDNGDPLPPTELIYRPTATYPSGKSVISLRFDDGYLEDYQQVFPRLQSAGLVGGFAVIGANINGASSNTATQLLEMQTAGMDIMNHSANHGVDPANYAAWIKENIWSGYRLRALGIQCASWVQPGSYVGAYAFNTDAKLGTPEELLLRKYYNSYNAYFPAAKATSIVVDPFSFSSLPPGDARRWGFSSTTADTGVDLTDYIDKLVANNCAGQLLFHPHTHSDWTFLDDLCAHIATHVAAGDLACLTPSQAMVATAA